MEKIIRCRLCIARIGKPTYLIGGLWDPFEAKTIKVTDVIDDACPACREELGVAAVVPHSPESPEFVPAILTAWHAKILPDSHPLKAQLSNPQIAKTRIVILREKVKAFKNGIITKWQNIMN